MGESGSYVMVRGVEPCPFSLSRFDFAQRDMCL